MKKFIELGEAAFYAEDKIHLDELSLSNYISTDNLISNKKGKIDASSLPPQAGYTTKFDIGDILVANIRPYLKKIWLATQTGGNSNDVLTIKTKDFYYNKFIFYCLFSDDFFDHMMRGSKGTKMPRGDKNQILKFPVPDFSYRIQKKIGDFLFQFDQKIAINNTINENIDELSKTIYEYWFVQFDFPDENGKSYKSAGGEMVYNEQLKREIPEGWEVKSLSDWIKNDKSGDWGKESEQGNYIEKVSCIRGADINGLNGNGEVKAPTRFILEKNSHKILEPQDLVVEISGGSPTQSTGRLAFITEETLERFENPIICSNFCKALTLKNKKYLFNFVYLWNRLYENDVLFGWEGKTSGIKNLLFDTFSTNYYVPVPPEYLAEKFYEFMKPMQAKKQKNLVEINELENLRDWLLPMLMNGQVSVGEGEEELRMVVEPTENFRR